MKFALVTGASSGIGLAFARQLAARGHAILVVSNQASANETVAEELHRDYGVPALPLYADLSRSEAAETIYEWCGQRNIEVDILISNAGILHCNKLIHTDLEAIDRITTLHCTTPAKLCRLFGEEMCRRKEGLILIVCSMTAWMPLPTMSLYGSTKAFLKNLGQSLWYEWGAEGVSVTTLFPGAVDTPLYKLDDNQRHRLRRTGIMLSADRLAARGLKAMFHRRRRCIPGAATQGIICLCRCLPSGLVRRLLRIPPVQKILDRL